MKRLKGRGACETALWLSPVHPGPVEGQCLHGLLQAQPERLWGFDGLS